MNICREKCWNKTDARLGADSASHWVDQQSPGLKREHVSDIICGTKTRLALERLLPDTVNQSPLPSICPSNISTEGNPPNQCKVRIAPSSHSADKQMNLQGFAEPWKLQQFLFLSGATHPQTCSTRAVQQDQLHRTVTRDSRLQQSQLRSGANLGEGCKF